MIQKNLSKILCRIIFLALILSMTSQSPAFSGEKVILTTHNLHPYGSYPDDIKIQPIIADETFTGEAIGLVRCVFQKMDIPLEIQVFPWKRAQMHVKQGLADGFFAASQKNTRDEFAVMTAEIADQKWNWYLLKENPLNPNDPSFKEKAEVGGFLGANMLKWMQANGYHVTAMPKDTEGLLKMLLGKRVDAVMANNHVMAALLKKYGAEDQVKIYLNRNKPLYIYFSNEFVKSRPGFIEKFNRLIQGCRK